MNEGWDLAQVIASNSPFHCVLVPIRQRQSIWPYLSVEVIVERLFNRSRCSRPETHSTGLLRNCSQLSNLRGTCGGSGASAKKRQGSDRNHGTFVRCRRSYFHGGSNEDMGAPVALVVTFGPTINLVAPSNVS